MTSAWKLEIVGEGEVRDSDGNLLNQQESEQETEE
jgi:hypothetical protein